MASGEETISPIHTAVAVGVASGPLLAANAGRGYALFVNDSDTTVYISFGVVAALNTGIRLNANGGSYEMSPAFGNLHNLVVNAISSASSKNVLVTEGT